MPSLSAEGAILLPVYPSVPFSRLLGVPRADVFGMLQERGDAARASHGDIQDPDFRQWAAGFTGASRTAKTARRLVSHAAGA